MAYKRPRKDFEADLQKQKSPHVAYGTPLPPLDDHMRDDGSYVPVWKQEVTDDRGRKRLHGAFTGGFSAGYFNSVGSKEGWTPSTFVSSRTNRAKDARQQAQQRPEDFMDEEDIREQEESRHLSTTEGFAGFGTADDENQRNAFMDLFRPAEDTMGMKMLNKMGWKQGQGIGPKVRRKIDPEDISGEVHLFAPEDVPMLSFLKKTDYSGLGASGENRKMTFTSERQASVHALKKPETQSEDKDNIRPGLSFASRDKKSTSKRGAFGIGVLNDTGSDDEDACSIGPNIAYNKTIGGDKKSKKSRLATTGNANPLLKNKPVFVPKRLSTVSNTLRKCHDGRLPLDGFVLADELDKMSNMSLNDEKYRPPSVPEDWKSSRVPNGGSATQTDSYQSTAEAAKSSAHTSSSRGTILGESALPGKSVFDFLTPAARDKLMKASGRANLPPALSESLPGASLESSAPQVPSLDPRTALLALSRTLNGGFTPYPNDPLKAGRYKAYLELQANIDSTDGSGTLPASKPTIMTKEDHITELHEFARTAEVFKPMSGLIASRFTTSSSTSQSLSSSTDPSTTDLLTNSSTRPKDPAAEAAAMGMFGHLTRSVSSFYPTRLLCKRFGVALPSHAEVPQGSYDADASSRFQSTGSQRPEEDNDKQSDITKAHGQSRTEEGEQLAIEAPPTAPTMSSTVKVDPDTNDALEQERPGAAVFRAIFGDSDADDEGGE